MNNIRKKICFVVAVPTTAQAFLKDHIDVLCNDYDVFLVGNIQSSNEVCGLKICSYHNITINRKISMYYDVKAVYQLFSYFKKMKFDAIHSVTPKAGLLCAIAGFFANTRIRIHIFTGQVWATRRGMLRCLLKFFDYLIARLNTHLLVDGNSQKKFLIENKIINDEKAIVLGEGSICGVNVDRFNPSIETRIAIRNRLAIKNDNIVFVFMGRLNSDKGLHQLLPAFNMLLETNKNAFLLLLGSDEENIASTFKNYMNISSENFLYYGETREPQIMLQAGDVFVLPTFREGFGSSVIEAACLGLPTITSDAYGVIDASIPNVTGLQCKVGDIESLYYCMKELANNPEMRLSFGKAGRKRTVEIFASNIVVDHWKKYYDYLLQ